MRERWGTFSVGDHIVDAPFVGDVLLYDRLFIPAPDPKGGSPDDSKFWAKFKPDLLHECLKILGVHGEDKDGLAHRVVWDSSKRDRFRNRMSTASAVAAQARSSEQNYYMDPFEMTRQLIKEEFLPEEPAGVSKAWTVAAYNSSDKYSEEVASIDPNRQRRLAAKISHKFLSPKGPDPNHEMLKRAVDLAHSDDFRSRRRKFYAWQEEIIEDQISDQKAIEELEKLLEDYNKVTEKAFGDVVDKLIYTDIFIGLGMLGAYIAGNGMTQGLLMAGAGGFVQLLRFWQFERKPTIANGDLDAAAMIYDAQKILNKV